MNLFNAYKTKKEIFFLMPICLVFLFACRPARTIEKGEEHFLNTVEIEVESDGEIDEEGVEYYVKQKPNRKMAGVFRFHLWVWNNTRNPWLKSEKKNGKERFRQKLNHVIGEEPVVVDTILLNKSKEQIQLHLENEGYFESKVDVVYEEKKLNKKKMNVKFVSETGPPTTIKHINYDIPQQRVRWVVMGDTLSSLVQVGDVFKLENLKAERSRINRAMNQRGYIFFNEEYIQFTADTIGYKNEVVLTLSIKHPPQIAGDTLTKIRHQRYKVKNIYVQPDFATGQENNITNQEEFNDIVILSKGKYKIDKEILDRNIFIQKGEFYNYLEADKSYASLANLGVFSLINIRFEDYQDSGKYFLDVYVELAPLPQHSLMFETEGTMTSGNPGLGGSFVYTNKNTFGGAERFNFIIHGGSEVQISSFIPGLMTNTFNTREFGPEMSLVIPHFLLPSKMRERTSKNSMPRTSITTSYNFEERIEYKRNLLKLSLGYEWNETKTKKHFLNPIEIGLSKFDPNSPILLYADTSDNVFIKNSFRNYLNVGNKYSFLYNSQSEGKSLKHYFRADVEMVGNLLSLLDNTSLMTYDGTYHYFLGIRYARYIRGHFDYRQYYSINKNHRIAFRTELGLSAPLKNNETLPFDRAFFSGGSNSLRAWTNRTVGPGAYYQDSETPLTQLGDFKFEMNLEYRFNLNTWIEGVLFADAGNIWLYKENEDLSFAHFKWNRSYKEIALGAGTGLRFDFSFLIIRLDWGVPLYSPGLMFVESTNTYQRPDLSVRDKLRNSKLSFGIGYPF